MNKKEQKVHNITIMHLYYLSNVHRTKYDTVILIELKISFIMLNKLILNLIVLFNLKYPEYKLTGSKHYFSWKIKIMIMLKILLRKI
jgi:hypothetical protein